MGTGATNLKIRRELWYFGSFISRIHEDARRLGRRSSPGFPLLTPTVTRVSFEPGTSNLNRHPGFEPGTFSRDFHFNQYDGFVIRNLFLWSEFLIRVSPARSSGDL